MKTKSARSHLSTPQSIAYWAGFAVMLTGLVHLLAYPFVESAVWSGPLGYRKLVVFGLSAGFTLVTMGWLLKFYPPKPRLHKAMMSAMSAALVLEIIIINTQHFRGLPSHFNVGTPLDTLLWSTMGLSILCFAIVSTTQAILAFGKLVGSPAMKLAIRTSMVLFFFSQLSGQLIVIHGMNHVLQDGAFLIENVASSTTYGEAGNLKLPHAISLHSIQALPLLALMIIGLGLNKRQQELLIWVSSIGFAGVTFFSQVHAYTGRSIFDLDTFGTLIMIVSLIGFLTPFIYATTAQILRLAQPSTNKRPSLHQPLSA
ncbi:hypothetical protein [Pelagicoccus mobilis]|uniref:Uncharacterized protein n=1 Tax=Pelagicoccus mobilis TaxID=415221 RepID=A0A934VQA1_9BACT|nr:hypothetical protein [Pelagicoccus mobilis]MBK1876680.1 hypothetical protein [Pelagicoccus mobilis]